MKVRIPVLALAATASLMLPALSNASGLYHLAPGEVGYTYHPEHGTSSKTRADQDAEVLSARRDGSLALTNRGYPMPLKSTQPPRTRDEVLGAMRAETPEQRKERQDLATGAN